MKYSVGALGGQVQIFYFEGGKKMDLGKTAGRDEHAFMIRT